MNRHILPSLITLSLGFATSAVASQNAHVHGEGQVNIAIEGNQLSMRLESPGADIVGFEHEAHSNSEKAAVQKAIAQLSDPMQMLRIPGDAECKVAQANAMLKGETDEHHEHEHEHDEHAKHDEHEHAEHEHDNHDGHDDDSKHGGHDGHKDEEAHASFFAEYELTCANMQALESMEFLYFQLFANAQSLDVILIDSQGQRRAEIDRANPVLRLTE